MTDLTDLLERTANGTPVGPPPPLDALRAGAARRRHRRTAGLAAAAVAVAAVIGGSTLLAPHGPTPPATSPTPATVPAATRLVGFGHAAIAVPADWPTNKTSCGTPQQDTVQIDDPSALHLCLSYRPSGVDSVELSGSPRSDFRADETFTIGGVPAKRQRTTCVTDPTSVEMCSGVVGIPTLGAWFRAESSTGAAEVDRILDRIQISPDRSGVPSYWGVAGPPTGPLAENCTPLLAGAGLKAQYKRIKSPSYPSGTILGVSPRSGTMIPLGSTVTVTVAR